MTRDQSKGRTPAELASEFLAALDAERWSDAADLLEPGVLEAFRAQWVEVARIEEKRPRSSEVPETLFLSVAEILRVRNAAEVEALSASEVFAGYAEAAGPARAGEAPFRVRSTLLRVEWEGDTAVARYRTELYVGETPRPAHPWWNGVRDLSLTRCADGWRVRDVAFGAAGGGGLLVPEVIMDQLR